MSMTLLTYNTAMLPEPTGTDKQVRARGIIEVLLRYQYDIICLQEVFDEDIRELFRAALAPQYPTIVARSDDHDFLNEDSGLFFASKLPQIGMHGFREFRDSVGWDAMADKGVFGIRLKAQKQGKDHSLFVFNTHLQSDESNAHIRARQLREVREFIFRALEKKILGDNAANTSCLLAGDFNVIGDVREEYRTMFSHLGYPQDLFRECHTLEDEPGHTWNGQLNTLIHKNDPKDKDLQRLDYIFQYEVIPEDNSYQKFSTLNTIAVQDIQVAYFNDDNGKGDDLSDHYGLELQFTL